MKPLLSPPGLPAYNGACAGTGTGRNRASEGSGAPGTGCVWRPQEARKRRAWPERCWAGRRMMKNLWSLSLLLAVGTVSCSQPSQRPAASETVVMREQLAFFTSVARAVAEKNAVYIDSASTDDTAYYHLYSPGEGRGGPSQSSPATARDLLSHRRWAFDFRAPRRLECEPVGVRSSAGRRQLIAVEAVYDVTGEPGLVVVVAAQFSRENGQYALRQLTVKHLCQRTR